MKLFGRTENGSLPELGALDSQIKAKRREIKALPGLIEDGQKRLAGLQGKIGSLKPGHKREFYSDDDVQSQTRINKQLGDNLLNLPAELLILLKAKQNKLGGPQVDAKLRTEIEKISQPLRAVRYRLAEIQQNIENRGEGSGYVGFDRNSSPATPEQREQLEALNTRIKFFDKALADQTE